MPPSHYSNCGVERVHLIGPVFDLLQLKAEADEAAHRAAEAAANKNEAWQKARAVGDEADAEAKAHLREMQAQAQAHVQAKEE